MRRLRWQKDGDQYVAKVGEFFLVVRLFCGSRTHWEWLVYWHGREVLRAGAWWLNPADAKRACRSAFKHLGQCFQEVLGESTP